MVSGRDCLLFIELLATGLRTVGVQSVLAL